MKIMNKVCKTCQESKDIQLFVFKLGKPSPHCKACVNRKQRDKRGFVPRTIEEKKAIHKAWVNRKQASKSDKFQNIIEDKILIPVVKKENGLILIQTNIELLFPIVGNSKPIIIKHLSNLSDDGIISFKYNVHNGNILIKASDKLELSMFLESQTKDDRILDLPITKFRHREDKPLKDRDPNAWLDKTKGKW